MGIGGKAATTYAVHIPFLENPTDLPTGVELICRAAATAKATAKTLSWNDDLKTKKVDEQQGEKKRKQVEKADDEV